MALIINGVAPGAGASALGDLTDIGTMGEPIAESDNLAEVMTAMGGASAVRTSVQAAGRTVDAMDGTGWTSLTPASGASTTWSGGKVTLAIPTLTNALSASGVYDGDYLGDDESYDFMCRVDVVAGDAVIHGNLILWAGHGVALGSPTDGILFILNSSGTVEVVYKSVSSDFSLLSATAGPDAGQRTGGNLWMRITRSPTALACHWGVGTAGAVPTSSQWTTVYAGSNVTALNVSRGYGARVDINTFDGGISGGYTVDVLAIRARAQNSAPL